MAFLFRKRKYGNKKVTIDNIVYDSKKEYERWVFLNTAEQHGLITDLRRQVPFELLPAIYEDKVIHLKTKDKIVTKRIQKAVTYKADFTYKKSDTLVVEDVKGSPKMIDKVFLIKEKMMRYFHGIAIKRVYNSNEDI